MTRRRIWMNPEYEALRPFVEQIPETMESQGTYVYGGRRNLIVKMETADGLLLNVKRFCQPRLLSNLVYSTGLRLPKGRRAFAYPQLLDAKGIETPQSVAYIEERNSIGLLGLSWFVSLQCPYSHLLYEVGDAPVGTYEALADALGRMAAHMHQQEVLHLDFSPGNVLWDLTDGEYRFSVVDINRMRFGPVSQREGCRSFARLWGPKRFIELTVRAYARCRGFDEAVCVDLAMASRKRFWRHYQKKREMEFKLEL